MSEDSDQSSAEAETDQAAPEAPPEEESGDLLSAAEIEALLDLVEEGDARVASSCGEVERRDFKRPRLSSRRAWERLRYVLGDSLRDLGRALSDHLNLDIQCELTALEEMRFDRHLERLGEVGLIYPWNPPEGDPLGFIELELGCASAFVDRLLGGNGKTRLADHQPTTAELPLLRPVVEDISGVILEGLGDVLEDEFEAASLAPAQTTTHSIRKIPHEMPTLCVEIAVCGEISTAVLRVILLSSMLRRGADHGPPDPVEGARRALERVPLALQVVLGKTRLRLRDLIGLEVGDVLRLPTRSYQELDIEVQGRTRLRGLAGSSAGHLGLRITQVVQDGQEQRDEP